MNPFLLISSVTFFNTFIILNIVSQSSAFSERNCILLMQFSYLDYNFHIKEISLCCPIMYLIFISAVFLLVQTVVSFDLEGSGDETPFNLGNEELIPYIKTKFTNSVLQKKTRKVKHKQPTNSTTKDRKGGYRQSKAPYYDLCQHFRCSHNCRLSNNNAYCSCREGFELHSDGKSCLDIDECRNFNGGCEQVCINTIGSYYCECQEHYRLRNDSKASCEAYCSPPCLNNGECIGPNICSCLPGYLQPKCSPICNPPCANGGICKRHNTCKCYKNYSGSTCLVALCKPSCLNGGRCIAPNTCQCPSNYFGETCQKALCVPPCEHGGTCIAINQCICRNGFKGSRCQTKSTTAGHACNSDCTTWSTSLAESSHPKLRNCSPPCQNGGRCTFANKCTCVNGTYGHKCQHRRCPVITFTSKITRMVRLHVTETFLSDCHVGTKQKCVSYRLVEKMIPKTFHKLGYKLHCS